jgi:hypothetical protein
VDGRPSYSAWYELWPQQPDTVTLPGFKVGPGDNVSASVAYSNSTKVYKFFIGDGSETDSFSPSYANSSVSSAEWIVEAPGFLNGTRLPLSNFSAVHFGESFATISSHTNAITGFGGQSFSNLYERTYVCNNETRAQPGPVTIGGADFTVTWLDGAGCPQ